MLRLLGVVFILGGFWGIGILYCDSEEKRLRIVKDWKSCLQILITEIEIKKQPLCFALQECSKRISGEVGLLWENISTRMLEEKEDFSTIWKEEFSCYLDTTLLSKEGRKQIEDFFCYLGYEEKDLQIEMLREKGAEIERYRKDLETEKGIKKKLSLVISSSAGVVLALLLL